MDSERLYSKWITFDEQTSNELKGLTNKEIEDRFYKELTFGTGGIRGKVGAGTNRMNYYTVARVTKGVAKYLIDNYNKPFVVIAYDSRRYSLEFTRLCYRIFISYGIKVKMFKRPTPTPILSYAVRSLKASLGIVITASHNPKEYNGYKVYSEDGGQITTNTTNEIYSNIVEATF
ncbi:MAG: hypothetical protein RR645_04005 [Clostridium sp.]